jgi:hypothetical protein
MSALISSFYCYYFLIFFVFSQNIFFLIFGREKVNLGNNSKMSYDTNYRCFSNSPLMIFLSNKFVLYFVNYYLFCLKYFFFQISSTLRFFFLMKFYPYSFCYCFFSLQVFLLIFFFKILSYKIQY